MIANAPPRTAPEGGGYYSGSEWAAPPPSRGTFTLSAVYRLTGLSAMGKQQQKAKTRGRNKRSPIGLNLTGVPAVSGRPREEMN